MDREKFMALAAEKYDRINALNDSANLFDYEKGLVELLEEFGREIMEEDLKGQSKDRRKKRNINPPLDKSK